MCPEIREVEPVCCPEVKPEFIRYIFISCRSIRHQTIQAQPPAPVEALDFIAQIRAWRLCHGLSQQFHPLIELHPRNEESDHRVARWHTQPQSLSSNKSTSSICFRSRHLAAHRVSSTGIVRGQQIAPTPVATNLDSIRQNSDISQVAVAINLLVRTVLIRYSLRYVEASRMATLVLNLKAP
jgi:hypothetical protein